jgi:hypothetical protein
LTRQTRDVAALYVNLHDTKTRLSCYQDQALAAAVGPRCGGFLRGQATISADLKSVFQHEMEEMFSGE